MITRIGFKTFIHELDEQQDKINKEWNTLGVGDIQIIELNNANFYINELRKIYQGHVDFLEKQNEV